MSIPRQQYRIIVGKDQLFFFLIYMILIKPAAAAYMPSINVIWNIVQMLVFLYGGYILCIKKKSRVIRLLIVLYSLFLTSAVFNSADVIAVARQFAPYLFCAVLTEYWINKHGLKPIFALHSLLVSYSIINLATILVFPDGLYTSVTSDGISHVACWFLGYKNPQIRTLLIALVLEFLLYSSPPKHKLKKRTIIFTAIVVYSTVYVRSGTALIALILFLTLLFLLRKDYSLLARVLSPTGIIIVYLAINIVIVGWQTVSLPFIAAQINGLLRSDIGTMNSRTYVWQAAMLLIKNNPILGNGGLPFTASIYGFRVTHPHNYMLYQWLSGGVLSVMLTVIMYHNSLLVLFKERKAFANRLLICAICSILMMGIAESLTEFPLLYAFLVLCNNIKTLQLEINQSYYDLID